MIERTPVEAPFPYFGGKSRCTAEVWRRFGDVPNYVEPFAGSLAVLLARPTPAGIETINDLDGMVINAWRSISADPDAVAYYADWPVTECDLSARHAYLVERIPWLTERLMGDPAFCVPKLAGWWIWGAGSWIGTGWCSGKGPWVSRGGMLVLREGDKQLPHLGTSGCGVNKQLPHLGDAGRGVAGNASDHQEHWTPHGEAIREWMRQLQERLRHVRMACGDWSRVVTPIVTWRHGTTAVFLDPPYASGEMEYAAGDPREIGAAVQKWCLENGDDPRLRIAVCGHDGDNDLPGWSVYHWKARGGYGNQGGVDKENNRHRETILFSPHCLAAHQRGLFDPPSAALPLPAGREGSELKSNPLEVKP